MYDAKEPDEIEVIDLEEFACSDKPIPKRVKYFLIKVDDEKFRVQSPVSAKEVLVIADLEPCDYRLVQKFRDGTSTDLEPDDVIDLREKGVERFESVPSKTITVIVNGREKTVTQRKLSFKQLIKLAFDNPPTGENICFTVTFRKGSRKNPEGMLDEGGSVKVKCGMVFNVTATDKS